METTLINKGHIRLNECALVLHDDKMRLAYFSITMRFDSLNNPDSWPPVLRAVSL